MCYGLPQLLLNMLRDKQLQHTNQNLCFLPLRENSEFLSNVPDCIRFGVVVIVWGQAPNTEHENKVA